MVARRVELRRVYTATTRHCCSCHRRGKVRETRSVTNRRIVEFNERPNEIVSSAVVIDEKDLILVSGCSREVIEVNQTRIKRVQIVQDEHVVLVRRRLRTTARIHEIRARVARRRENIPCEIDDLVVVKQIVYLVGVVPTRSVYHLVVVVDRFVAV